MDEITYCLKTMCPNTATHKSGYCKACRTFKCPDCQHEHTIIEAPHAYVLRFCVRCRRLARNKNIKEPKPKVGENR